MTRYRFCESKFNHQKDTLEWKEISKNWMGAAKNAMMAEETKDSEEEGNEIASACILEEVNLRKTIRPGD